MVLPLIATLCRSRLLILYLSPDKMMEVSDSARLYEPEICSCWAAPALPSPGHKLPELRRQINPDAQIRLSFNNISNYKYLQYTQDVTDDSNYWSNVLTEAIYKSVLCPRRVCSIKMANFFYRWLRAMGWVWVGHEKSRLQQVCCSERNLRCLYILSHFEGLFINICRELKFALQSNVTDRLIATNTIWPIFLFQASLYQMGAFPSWHDLGHIHTSAMSIYIS